MDIEDARIREGLGGLRDGTSIKFNLENEKDIPNNGSCYDLNVLAPVLFFHYEPNSKKKKSKN